MLRKFLSCLLVVCVMGAVTALVFVNISGTSNDNFVSNFYFSEVEGTYRWTMYGVCQQVDNGAIQCSSPSPAYPYSPAENFSFNNIPEEFRSQRNTYYYLLRIAYGFFLVGLLFSVLSLIVVILPGCSMGHRTGLPATTMLFMTFLFATVAATLDTVAHMKGVRVFTNAGFRANIGRNMFICMWTGAGLMFVAACALGIRNRLHQTKMMHPRMANV